MKRSLRSVSGNVTSTTQYWLAHHGARQCLSKRSFHSTTRWQALKPFILADIGEGIREVQIIQWFVQPGARVEQFDKICEVASDKAIVEITSRYDGVIKKLHYEADAMAQVGKPLCDIDIQGATDPVDETSNDSASSSTKTPETSPETTAEKSTSVAQSTPDRSQIAERSSNNSSRKSSHLATPAVRGLLREHNLDISQIQGTGREGRVMKNDVHNHLNAQGSTQTSGVAKSEESAPRQAPTTANGASSQTETLVNMTPVQSAMFKAMTRSLSIPHFLYSDEVDMTDLSHLRSTINTSLASRKQHQSTDPHSKSQASIQKLSYMPFIIKAVSLALNKYPVLNATFSTKESSSPKLVHRSLHNIGIAMDTPAGLLVPVIKDVASLCILEIAQQLSHLQSLAASGKLISQPDLLTGGTITMSNIGNIGGGVLSPVLVEGQSAILGIGKAKELPRFGDKGDIQRRLISTFSWTADHRVLDGATVARFAEEVATSVRTPGRMIVDMK